MPQPLLEAVVTLEAEATDDDRATVRELCAEFGIEPDIGSVYMRKGIGDYPWMVIIAVPFLPFVTTLASEAGKDAYGALKSFHHRLREARDAATRKSGTIILQDTATRLRIQIDHDLPDEALSQLVSLDLTQFKTGSIRWDPDARAWRSLTEW